MRLAGSVLVAMVAACLAVTLQVPLQVSVYADGPCQLPGIPGLLQGADASTISGHVYVVFDSAFTEDEVAAIRAGIEYWPQSTTTYAIHFGPRSANEPEGLTLNIVPNSSLAPNQVAHALAVNGSPVNIGINSQMLGNNQFGPNFWQFHGAHEFGHQLGFSHVPSSEIGSSVMANPLDYGVANNWTKPANMLVGDSLAFRTKYKINGSDPDDPCATQSGESETVTELVEVESIGWYECSVDVTVEDHYIWTEDGWQYQYSVVYSSQPYNCYPVYL